MTTLPASISAPPAVLGDDRVRQRKQRWIVAGIVAGVLILLVLISLAVYWMGLNPGPTQTIRDIFIILAAVVLLFIMLALAVLIVQIARLINLLQHEIKPILASTNETVSTVRGTAEFLGDNLVEPVLKFSSYLAALQRLVNLLKLGGFSAK